MISTNQDILSKILDAHQKAEDFRRDHTTNRYPLEFKELVRTAIDSGLTVHKIHQATGVNLNTLCSWRKPLNEPKDILCFEPVPPKSSIEPEEKGRFILPSGIEILFPMSFIKNHLMTWLSQDAA
ncbi:MAG: hypothetical protein AB8G05_20035 [Oligoflexales bacterium]